MFLTHLRPGFFYYNLDAFVDMIKTVGFIAVNYRDGKLLTVDSNDIAKVAAEVISERGVKMSRFF